MQFERIAGKPLSVRICQAAVASRTICGNPAQYFPYGRTFFCAEHRPPDADTADIVQFIISEERRL